MARNSWYAKKEETYLMKRSRELKLLELPYGGRRVVYQRVTDELEQRFGIRRPWQGVRQKALLLLRSFENHNGEII